MPRKRLGQGVPTVQELEKLGLRVSGELRPALIAVRECLDAWSQRSIEQFLEVVHDELELAGWETLDDDQRKGLLKVFQAVRKRLRRAKRAPVAGVLTGMGGIAASLAGISSAAAVWFGPIGVVLLAFTYSRYKAVEDTHDIAKILCEKMSGNK